MTPWKRALISVAAVLSMIAPAVAQPPSFPLMCQGGSTMRIVVNHDVNSTGVPGATAMFVYFKAGSTPASAAPPHPGECTWTDRVFRPGEPTVMWIKSPRIQFAFQVLGSGQIVRDASGLRLDVEGAGISPEAAGWESIVKAVTTGRPFTVRVYNSGGSSPVMVITHIGP